MDGAAADADRRWPDRPVLAPGWAIAPPISLTWEYPQSAGSSTGAAAIPSTTGFPQRQSHIVRNASLAVSGRQLSRAALGWDVGHGTLGQRGDREGGVDADVGRDGGAVADQQVLVAEHAVAVVDHPGLWVCADDGPAEDVGGHRDREDRLGEHRLGGPAKLVLHPLSGTVGGGDLVGVGALGILLCGEHDV